MFKRGKLLVFSGLLTLLLLCTKQATAQCTAAFTGSMVLCQGDTLRLTAVTISVGLTSDWTFGDGDSDTGLFVEHVYANPGVYAVSHRVQNAACVQMVWDTVEVLAPPQLAFTTENDCSDDLVSLFAQTLADNLDTLAPAVWFSGAGDTLTGDTAQVVYPSGGYYTVHMQVNGRACFVELDSQVFISQRPQAGFAFGSSRCLGDTLAMTSTGSAYKPTYLWNFGDVFSGSKNTDSVANPIHRFSQAGTYSVRLVVTDTLNCRDTLTQTVKILQTAAAAFDYNDVCAGAATLFTQGSTLDAADTLLSYTWDFGDGDTSSSEDPSHTYADSGHYVVRLIIHTSGSCADTLDKTVFIHLLPDISLDTDSACAGTSVNYQLTSSSAGIASYLWNFGDGFTSTSSIPAHQYTTAGLYPVRLRTTYTEGKTCFSPFDSVRVLALPSASFIIDEDTHCYKGNSVCVRILDQSPLTRTRRVLFDDGFVDVDHGPSDTVVCHAYTDAAGGSYFIAVQMLDSNGCSQSLNTDTAVVIHPEFDTDFDQNIGAGCFQTEVQFINSSNQGPPEITRFYWDFGDGSRDSSTWGSPGHIYTGNGSYTVKLWAENEHGCQDSTLGASSVVNTSYTVNAAIDSIQSGCASNNRVYAHQSPVPGGEIRWNWMDGDTSYAFSAVHFYELPGIYRPRVTITLNGCDSTVLLDTVTISGPYARFAGITNRFQCQVDDTVYFTNGSDYFLNTRHNAIWDFGDFFAPTCTSNFADGINAASNCRYNTDSISTKHMYDRNAEGCYSIRLVAYDSVSGCSDTVFEQIALTPPVAGPDSALSLLGMQTLNTLNCLGPEAEKQIIVSLAGTQPLCNREFFWVMWDSACAVESGNFNGQWQALSTAHNYNYGEANCDPNGFVTLGLIVQNGMDSLGNVCRDTAWYHNELHFNNMNPAFASSYQPTQYYCKGSTFDFFLTDTAQDSVFRVVWDWGDGTMTDTMSTDTVQHTYGASGNYMVVNRIFTTDGCQGSDTMFLNVGLSSNLNFSQNQVCVGDSFQIVPQIFYLGDGYPYWNDPTRIAAGKESIFFDIGDGNGFQQMGTSPWVQGDQVKNFALTVVFEDSLGCWDSIYYNDSVRVYGAFAEFSTQLDTFLCPQAIPFTSLGGVYDSTAGMAQPGDALVSFVWTFDSLLAPSQLENPERYLSTGTYSVQLKVTNSIGCTDSVTHDVTVRGPIALYTITGDSSGCSPLRITFQNQSSFAGNYVWQFNDSANSVLSTTADSAFFFDYPKYGNYVATLTAQGSFDQNGIPITCSAVFPDSSSWDSLRLVTVRETPVADFSFLTDCASKSSAFENLSSQETDTNFTYIWYFGDGDTSSQEDPFHTYSDTGHYTVMLFAYSLFGCEDSIAREVVIAPPPVAWFTYSEVCLGTTSLFDDSTEAFNDQIYDWEWTFGDGGSSVLEDPFHLYTGDSTYEVTLRVTNIGGCRDSVSRNLRVHSFPAAAFSAPNECRYDSVVFVDAAASSELPLQYTWDLGDGNSSTDSDPVHLYASSGTVTVRQRVETPWGCADSVEENIDIYQEPAAAFTVNDDEQCLFTQDFQFTDAGTTGSGTYAVSWDFGDSTTDAGTVVAHSYDSAGTYSVTQVLLSTFSCRDTSTFVVTVFPQAHGGFVTDDAFQCHNENTFVFSDTSGIAAGSISRTWHSGDGQSSTDSVYTYSYSDTGTYEVQLVLLSDQGCLDTVRQLVTVNPSPVADFSLNDSTQCLTDNLFVFNNLSTISNGSMSYAWELGDGTGNIQQHPTHSYTQDSAWLVQLVVTSDSFCRDTVQRENISYPMPSAGYSVDDSGQCLLGNNFLFTNESQIKSGSLSYRWFFGDADSSQQTSPGHSYLSEDVYTVVVIATSGFDCNDTLEKDVEVYPMPVSRIGMGDSVACMRDHSFALHDSGSISSGTWTRTWSFGQGSTDTVEHIDFTYSAQGTYPVSLVLVSGFGCKDSSARMYTIHPQATADFGINDSLQCFRDHTFNFTNLSTVSSGSLSYNWDPGDGNSYTTLSPSHTYSVYGAYTVELITTTPFGCADTMEKDVEVFPMPVSRIGIADSVACMRDHFFVLHDSGSIAAGTWTRTWFLDDGNTDTTAQFTYSYAAFGSYVVRLRLESEHGCADSMSRTYTVHPQAATAFAINDTQQCFLNHSFAFTNGSSVSGGGLTNDWDFGDGNTSSDPSPVHSYTTIGIYTVELISNTLFGCADTVEKDVEVKPMPQSRIGIADSVACYRDHSFVLHDSGGISAGTLTRTWFFGEGSTDTSAQLNHSYAAHGSYLVSLRLESAFGCKDSVTRVYTVHPQALAAFDINDTLQCFRAHDLDFTNNSSVAGGGLTYAWNFGDGNSDNVTSPSHVYSQFGDYTVRLIANTVFDCADTISKDLRIDPSPIARIWLNDSGQCINAQSFLFRDSTLIEEGIYSVQWYFGDGSGSVQEDIIHTYTQTGNMTARLVVISDKNCGDSSQLLMEVFPKPEPAFTINDSGQCVNTNDFQFTNGSTLEYGTLSYTWNWGDGTTSSLEHPAQTYSYPDTFRVVLEALSNEGCRDSAFRYTISFPKPYSSWVINDTAQCVNTNDFQFNSTVNLSSGNILHYFWDLENLADTGDLDTARTYANPGIYPVWFFAQTELNCWDTLTNTVIVHPKPYAVFSVNDTDQCVNTQDFIFTNSTTLSNGTLTYQWDFGDGDGSTDFEPIKTYLVHDSLLVTLYAQTDLACFDTTSHQIIILPKPQVDFAINDSDQCVNGNYFTFTNASAVDYGTLSYEWDLGNGETATMADTAMVYALQNTYAVELKAVSNAGCSDSLEKPLIVYPKPNPDFTVNDFGQCRNTQDFRFTDESSIDYGNLHYTWRFGDLTEDTLSDPEHVYPAHGIFAVRQVLHSDYGCLDSIEKNIQVLAKPTARFTINDSMQCVNTQDFGFTSNSIIAEGSIQNIAWDFDEGNTASGNISQNFFPLSGTYSVEMIARSDSNCYDTLYKDIRVFPMPVAAFDYNDSAQCLSGNQYDVHSLAFDSSGIALWSWTINTDGFSADSSFSHSFDVPGDKYIIQRVKGNDGCWDTIQRNVYVKPMPDPTFTGLRNFHCDNDLAFALTPVVPGGIFEGPNIVNQLYESRVLWDDSVQYWVEVNGCADSSMQYTQVYPFPQIELGPDTVLCKSEFLSLDVSFWGSEYVWQDGKEDPIYRIVGPGTYRADVSNVCGIASDSFVVSFLDDICRLYVPNAFTPNGDVHHQRYKPVFFDLDKMDYYIYTRWGELVYQGNIADLGWDGSYQGVPVADGVFVVLVKYQYTLHGQKMAGTVNGTVTLLR